VLVKFYRNESLHFKHIAVVIFSLVALLLLRNNLLLPLAPSVIAFLVIVKWKKAPVKLFIGLQILFLTLFFLSPLFGIDLPADVSMRQKEFIELGGRTAVHVPILKPDASGFLQNLPSAISIGFLKPYFLEGGLRYLPFTLEICLVFLCLIAAFFRTADPVQHIHLVLFCISLAVLGMLMIGYTVPNIGAVVRYRSVLAPFLLTGTAMLIDWQKRVKL